jgi:hypothetical protein
MTRLDGKQMTQKQIDEMVKKELEQVKKKVDEEDFDPRKHRLKHGIRNYDKSAGVSADYFKGMTGVKLK